METGIAKTENKVATTTFDSFKTMEDLLSFAENVIVKTKLSPLKTKEDVVAAILAGKEIGIPMMASISNIYPIEGKASLGIHIISGILLKNGIVTEIIKDYEPVFNLYYNPGTIKEEEQLVGTCFLDDSKLKEQGFRKGLNLIDYKTIVKFTRTLKQPDGTFSKMTITSSYSIIDATTAELIQKSNWKKNPKTMTRNRALAIGSRLIADDLLMGLLETTEALDISGVNYEVDNENNITILESTVNKPNINTTDIEDAVEEK